MFNKGLCQQIAIKKCEFLIEMIWGILGSSHTHTDQKKKIGCIINETTKNEEVIR